MDDRHWLAVLGCLLGLVSACAARATPPASKPSSHENTARAEVFASACESGNAVLCGTLGNMYLRGDRVAKDPKRAESLYARACDLGLASSCSNWGALVALRDPARAFGLFRRACDGGNAVGCFNEGHALANGEGVAKDAERATALFLSACDGGHAPACVMVGRAYLQGDGAPKDEAKAAPYLARACDGASSSLGQADGTPLPPPAEACAIAASLLAPLAKTEEERRNIAGMMERACNWGYALACNDAGMAYVELSTDADKAHGLTLIAKSCDKPEPDPNACANIGMLRMQSDPVTAATDLKRACDLGNGQACSNLGFLYSKGQGMLPDATKAAQLFERGCDLGNLQGCLFLGGIYYEGTGVKEDKPRARAYLDKACDGRIGGACADLARIYEYALGVDEDMPKARSYHRRACDAGIEDSCSRAPPVTNGSTK